MPEPTESMEDIAKRIQSNGKPIPQLVRENTAFWILYEKLAPDGKFPSVYKQRQGLKELGGLKNFIHHRKLGKLAFKWLSGEWHE